MFVSNRTGDHHLYSISATGGTITTLTSGNFDDDQPAYSPDGTMIVFSSGRSGSDALWRVKANGTYPKQLTFNTTVDDFAPNWAVFH